MPSAWVEHIKEFAKRKGLTYGGALSDPDCKAEYHAKRPAKLNKKEKKEVAGIEADLSIPVKKTRGRPKKYATDEERKKAKTIKTVESNKRKRQAKMGGGMIKGNPPLTKSQVNKLINFITSHNETGEKDPNFEKYVREEVGEDNIVSKFANSTIGYEVNKITEEDKEDLIPDLYDYVKKYFPHYQDSDLSISQLNKMRKRGNRGGSVPHRPVSPRRSRSKSPIQPVQPTDIEPPPPPPPPTNTPTAPRQTNRRRITQGGKLITTTPNPLTHEQGMTLMNILIKPQGNMPYPITEARHNQFRQAIERIGDYDDIENMSNRFHHFLVENIHHSQTNYIMDTYHKVLNYTRKKRKIEGGAVKRPRERTPSPIRIRQLTQAQGNAIRDALHHLNSPITGNMVADFGNIVADIGFRDIRTRFQNYLEGFTHAPSVVRFMNRFDRFMRLLQDEGAETDTEGGRLPNPHKDRNLLRLLEHNSALPEPPTNRLRDSVPEFSRGNVGYILIGIINTEGFVNLDLQSYRNLNERLTKLATLFDITMDQTIELFERGLKREITEPATITEIMDYLYDILYIGVEESQINVSRARGLLDDLKKREITGHHPDMTELVHFKELVKKIKTGKLPTDFTISELKLILKHNKKQVNANWIRNAKQTLDAMEDSDSDKESGRGLIAGYSTEAPNGLSHIYPLSHNHILKMCKHFV